LRTNFLFLKSDLEGPEMMSRISGKKFVLHRSFLLIIRPPLKQVGILCIIMFQIYRIFAQNT